MKNRWIITLLVIASVIAVSAALILLYHETPGEFTVQAVSDGKGGTIIAWQTGQGIYVQLLGPDDKPLWSDGGISIGGKGSPYTLKTDGMGGAIVAWADTSQGTTDRDDPAFFDPIPVYSQRISTNGQLLWGDGMSTGTIEWSWSSLPEIVPYGSGGIIFGWNDYKTYFKGLHDDFLRVQKVNPDGQLLWGNEGVLVTSSSPFRPLTEEEKSQGIAGTAHRSWPTYAGNHWMVSDGLEGVIVIWDEEDEHQIHHVYAHRLDSEGKFVWPETLLVTETTGYVSAITSGTIDSDGVVNLAIHNEDYSGVTIFLRIDRDGNLLWPDRVTKGTADYSMEIVDDGLGGIITSRYEYDPPVGSPYERSISLYLQRLDRQGNVLWMEIPVITTQKGKSLTIDISPDGTGGAVLTWRLVQTENNAYGKLFAQRLDAGGNSSWSEGGVTVFPDPGLKYQGMPTLVSDGFGNTVVVAAVGKSALRGDMIYAQKLDASGNRLWGNGVRIDR